MPSQLAGLTAFDWLLIGVLAWSMIAAFMRGLIRVLFSLGGWVAGILLASWNYRLLAPRLLGWAHPLATAQAVAFVLILVGVIILASLLGRLLRKTVSAVGLGFLDRLGGAVFGFVRGCLVGTAIMMLIAAFSPGSDAVAKSTLTPYFLAGAHAVCFVVPADLQAKFANGATRLKHNAPDWIKSTELRHN
ncbi:membrane protein required for colicin V production [Granulicella rosea]|uniref:Membrane protein required for colicin V production n=1 Tax=Granulicella rosea TaxID=474952 RepID=A0A239HL86_9BACT|nr:CvpA family protein [Granulicella rosea]SNS82166.1 membrane protein required for colicin V production [Granulicella rosea]